jgi:hypothetical protein
MHEEFDSFNYAGVKHYHLAVVMNRKMRFNHHPEGRDESEKEKKSSYTASCLLFC